MNLETTDAALQELQNMQVPELITFPTEFVSKLNGAIARSLDPNSKPFSLKSGNPQDVTFNQPAYIASVEIEFSRAVAGAGIELSVHEPILNKNIKKRYTEYTATETVNFPVHCVSSGISIYLQPGIVDLISRRTLDIKQIRITGYDIKDFEALTHSLGRLIGLKQSTSDELSREKNTLLELQTKIREREVLVDELEERKNEELESLQGELTQCAEDIKQSTAKLAELKEQIIRVEGQKQATVDQIAKNEATVRQIEGEVTKGKERLRDLAVETSEKEKRLRELTSNVNLFSEEFSSFSDHGAKQASTFIGLSIIPLAIIFMLTFQLLMGAVDLSVKYVKEPNLDLLTIFVTRLPYLTVCASILGVCYSICHFLFRRVSGIFAERLDFAKIGILAKDVASASASNLSLSEQELYEARTYLKIEMLKAYLSGNIGEYRYAKRNERPAAKGGQQNGGPVPDVTQQKTEKESEEDEE
jgi:hypothetical protein